MNVLFLTQTYPRYPGDTAGPFIRDLARGLVRGGDAVTVLTPHAAGVARAWDDDGVEVRSFRYAPAPLEVIGYSRSLEADERLRLRAALMTPIYALAAAAAVRRELSRRSYDLVHAHWVVPNGLIAGLAGVPARSRLAIGLHGSDVFLAERGAVRPLVRRLLARARLLTGCSPELVDRVRALGFAGDLWRVIPYGVDTDTFAPDRKRALLWRRRLSIPEAAPVLLSVGRMATKKGYRVLVEALPEVLTAFPDLHVVLAGAGDLLDEVAAGTRAWRRQVHLPGAVERDTLPDLYRAADLFVLPAVHDPKGNVDGLPNVILEAMASGLPVVASDLSGIPLAITSGIEGLLVPEGDAAALAAALGHYLADREGRRAAGAAGRRRAEQELNWDAVAARYRDGYRESLSQP